MKIRRQVYNLTLDDLDAFPVWEFALDEEGEAGQDEATVRPCDISGALDPSDGMFIVRAMFVLADGTKMRGYLTTPIQGDEGLGRLQPIIVTTTGQALFWQGVRVPDAEDLAQAYKKLGRGALETFPIEVTSDIQLMGPPFQATIPGFVILEDWKTGRTRSVT